MNDLNNYDIKDSDIRILGQENNAAEPKIMKGAQTAGHKEKKSHFTWAGVLLSVLIIALIIALKTCRNSAPEKSVYSDVVPTCESQESQTTFGYNLSTESNVFIVVSQETIDDIPLRLLKPTGGHMELMVGALDSTDTSIVMAACAADYRADNGEIAGAFVYKGELLSRGHPKLGFCAIIGREVTMGMSPETPLFERAVEQGVHVLPDVQAFAEQDYREQYHEERPGSLDGAGRSDGKQLEGYEPAHPGDSHEECLELKAHVVGSRS